MYLELKNGLCRDLCMNDISYSCDLSNEFDKHIIKRLFYRHKVECYLINNGVRTLVELHDGFLNKNYFGYISPTIFIRRP